MADMMRDGRCPPAQFPVPHTERTHRRASRPMRARVDLGHALL